MYFCRHFIWMALVAFWGMAFFSVTACGAEVSEPLYNINEAKSMTPEVYNIETSSSLSLFPVPQDNTIGTNDLNNAITLLSFHRGKLKKDQYFKNAFSQVGGGGVFLPVFSPDTIGFGQVRRFVFYNFRTKKHERYRIAFAVEDTIEKIAVADAEKRHFIFEIEAHNSSSDDPWGYTNQLQLMDLSGEEPKAIKQLNIGKVTWWTSAAEKIFLYNLQTKQMEVLDKYLSSSKHPLADLTNLQKNKFNFTRIQLHPYLPFSILEAGTKDEVIVTWDEDNDASQISIFGSGVTVTQFSFSPDGKWVVFQKDFPEPKQTYLMPVSEKYPNYLGSPILLLDNYFNEYNCAWTTNPISFVGSSEHKIYRWELTNAAHPESDKPTFHDYIVEKDLEKLTREKRQGLGENLE